MIIIDKDSTITTWLDTMPELEVGFVKVDLATFEIANGFVSEVLFIESSLFNEMDPNILEKVRSVRGIIIFEGEGNLPQDIPNNLLGVIRSTENPEVSKFKLQNIETLIKKNNLLKSELLTLNRELGSALGGVETELIRVKRAYEKKTPKRLEQFKGLKVYSKYAAGEDMGGEFFDLFHLEGEIFILMSSTSSYLASSVILQAFHDFKEQAKISRADQCNLIDDIRSEVAKINNSRKKDIHAELLTCVLDLRTLTIEGFGLGQFNILSSSVSHSLKINNPTSSELEDATFRMQIERGERILVNSPGFSKGWDTLSPEFMIEELVINKKIKALDVLDEIYFQLKKNSKNGFVASDASSIILEVQENVVHEV